MYVKGISHYLVMTHQKICVVYTRYFEKNLVKQKNSEVSEVTKKNSSESKIKRKFFFHL